jgi:hypothetical protein
VVPLRDVQPEVPQWSASSHSKDNAQRNPSGKLGPYSQSRQYPSSSSCQPILIPGNNDSCELDGTSGELNVNNTPATTLYAKPPTAPHSVMPSLKLLHEVSKPVLAELDMNQDRPVPRLTHCITPTEPKSSPYQAVMNVSVRTKLTPSHTTSQSLRVTSLPKRNYPRFSSQRSIDILDMPPATAFSGFENVNPGVEAKCRNLAEVVIPIEEETYFSEVNNVLPSNDNQQSLKAKSRRRHAIYTESLYVPYLDEGCDSHSRESAPKSSRLCSSDSYTELAQATRIQNLEFANASCLKPPDLGFSLVANQIPFAFTAASTKLLSSNRAPLLPTSRARSATLAEPRGLYYPADKPSRVRLLSGKDISHSEIVYPSIVLDLLAEINLAIEQWKPIV